MILCGALGTWEIVLILIVMIIVFLPATRMLVSRRENMTDKLDQIERLERLYQNGTLTKRQYNRQKSKILRGR